MSTDYITNGHWLFARRELPHDCWTLDEVESNYVSNKEHECVLKEVDELRKEISELEFKIASLQSPILDGTEFSEYQIGICNILPLYKCVKKCHGKMN